jgi:hypothetical protein
MARIRSIKPEFWVSEQIAECSTSARLTFVGLWTFSDDNGVHPAKPKTLKAELFPMDDTSSAEVATWMQELIRAGLVAEFEVGGERFWHITGWAKHQKIDRPSYKYPAPPEHQASQIGVQNFDDPSAKAGAETGGESPSIRLPLDDDSSNARRAPPPGVEWSGVESIGDAHSPNARHKVAQPRTKRNGRTVGVTGFEAFYAAYPKKKSRGAAEKVFAGLKVGDDLLGKMLYAIRRQSETDDWRKDDGQFIPYPATWLSNKGWLDEAPGPRGHIGSADGRSASGVSL